MRNGQGADVFRGHQLITANIRFKIASIKCNRVEAQKKFDDSKRSDH